MANSSSFCKLAPEDWVMHINNMLKDEDVAHTKICIHKVSKILRATKPEAYTPQLIGLGPYHHWRDDLYEMEQCKLIASKTSQEPCRCDSEAVENLKKLVSIIKGDKAQIRACYDRHLNEDDDTLAWMMVVDSIFLLQFLKAFVNREQSCLLKSSRTSYLLDRYQSAYHAIVKDIMKLENQIPTFVLEQILPSCWEIAYEDPPLPTMLLETCKELSPLKLNHYNLSRDNIIKCAHLLELLYYLIVPQVPTNLSRSSEDCERGPLLENEKKEMEQSKKCFPNVNPVSPRLELVGKLHIQLVQVVANSKPLKVIGKVAGVVTAVFPSFSSLSLTKSEGIMNDLKNNEDATHDVETPKFEEIAIPSVSTLLDIGMEFCPRKDGLITCIEFDKMAKILYLPPIFINGNTDVILRNLVAYEAEAISGPSVLARYTELMNGIVDTSEDVRLLRERGIIISYLKNDDDVAQLWNGMNRSTRLTYVPSIDKVIKEVNEFYDNKRRVKFKRFTKECVFYGWKVVMLLLALLLLVLMAIQSFCDVYRCPRVLGPVNATQGSNASAS